MNTTENARIDLLLADADEWGPDGRLGNDEANTKPAAAELNDAVDEALGLQMISIRLQRRLVRDLKIIADFHGVGYQPMIRDLLNRFVIAEFKDVMRDHLAALEAAQAERSTVPVDEFLRKRA